MNSDLICRSAVSSHLIVQVCSLPLTWHALSVHPQMSVRWLLPHLEHDAHKLPVALLPGAAAVMLSGQSDKLR